MTCDSVFAALLQLMAAAEAGRDVAYFTFGDPVLMRDVHELHTFLTDKHVTVGKNTVLHSSHFKNRPDPLTSGQAF